MSESVTIGRATLYLGDCRDFIATMPKVDTVVTSPPYNCGMDYGTASDNLALDQFIELLRASVVACPARVKVVNVGQYIGSRESRVRFRDVLEVAFGEQAIDEVIWNKGPANGAAWGNYPNSPRIRAQHESVFAFGDAKMPNGNGLDWSNWSRLTTSIWNIPAKVDLSIHPAMMPVDLAQRCVMLWADVQGVVFDPFMGSGTTAIAAIAAGRDFIGVEIDPAYYETACKRIEDAQRQGDLFIAGDAA